MKSGILTAQIIIGIIAEEMALPAATVWLRDQNKLIPNDNGLYIVAGLVDSQIIASESYLSTPQENWDEPGDTWDQPDDVWDDANTTNQICEVQARETIQVDVISRSNAALTRNWEVVAALQSIYAQQQMEANTCKTGRLPGRFINTSYAEGGSQLNRYTLTFPVFVWYRKSTPLTINGESYFDDFTTRIDTAQTIGTDSPAIEFEINPSGEVPP